MSEHLRAFARDGSTINSRPPFGLVLTSQPSPERTLAWEAFAHFDTNALRTVHAWLVTEDSAVARFIDRIASKQTLVPIFKIVRSAEAAGGGIGVGVHGEKS